MDFALKYAETVFQRYKDKVKYWITFNEINALLISPRPWHQAGIIYREDEKVSDVSLLATHHQLLASAKIVKAAHDMNAGLPGRMHVDLSPELSIYLPPGGQIVNREKMLPQFYCGDVQVRGYYSNTCQRFQELIGGHLTIEPEDEEILRQGVVDFISLSYYFSSVESFEPMKEIVGNVAKGGRNHIWRLRRGDGS